MPVVPGNLPQFQILVAFNNATFDDPATITTVASPPGTLGAAGQWTDITRFVRALSWQRGRQHELDRFQPGSGQAVLANETGQFTPWNTSSPYTGKVDIGKPFRIQATWQGTTYVLFTGHVKTWPIMWPTEMWSDVTIDFSDALAAFAIARLANQKYFNQIKTDGATDYFQLNDPAGRNTAGNSVGPLWGKVNSWNNAIAATAVVYGQQAGPVQLTNDTCADFGSYNSAANQTWIDVTGVQLGTGAFTVEFWLNTSQNNANAQMYYVTQFGSFTTKYLNTWQVVTGISGSTTPFEAIFQIYDSAGNPHSYKGGIPVNDGNWHHIVATWDGTNGAIYTDAVAGQAGALGATFTTPNANTMFIGGSVTNTGAIGGAYGGIKLGQFAFYRGVVLTAAQVLTHFKLATGAAKGTYDTQVGSILDHIGWPSAARSIDAAVTVGQTNTQRLTQTTALTYLQQIDQSEMGALFVDVNGKVRFISRWTLITNANQKNVQATFGDGGSPGELPFEANPQLALDDLDLWNQATVTRQHGVQQNFVDNTSTTSYGPHVTSISPLHNGDGDSYLQAQWIVQRLKTPITRFRSLVIRPVDDPLLPAAVLNRELMDRIVVNRHNLPGGGTAFTQTGLLERIQHQIDFQTMEWKVMFGLSPTEVQRWGIIGDPVYGVVGSTLIVAW